MEHPKIDEADLIQVSRDLADAYRERWKQEKFKTWELEKKLALAIEQIKMIKSGYNHIELEAECDNILRQLNE